MTESGRIILDVVEDFPGGYPREGDVVVLWPGADQKSPAAVVRYLDSSELPHLRMHAARLRCRRQECPDCPLGCRPGRSRRRALQVLD